MMGLGRILNNSWVCRLGCYHSIHDMRCDCKCHTMAVRFPRGKQVSPRSNTND